MLHHSKDRSSLDFSSMTFVIAFSTAWNWDSWSRIIGQSIPHRLFSRRLIGSLINSRYHSVNRDVTTDVRKSFSLSLVEPSRSMFCWKKFAIIVKSFAIEIYVFLLLYVRIDVCVSNLRWYSIFPLVGIFRNVWDFHGPISRHDYYNC